MAGHIRAGGRTIGLVDAAIGEGAGDSGCRWGGAALREAGLVASLACAGRRAHWADTVASEPARASDRFDSVEDFTQRLAASVGRVLSQGQQPLVVGGDHSCAVGTWSAVAQHLRPQGALGLVWVDAHLDAHTPETSDTQAPHGMPLAALLGHGRRRLTHVHGWSGKVRPEHVVVIGARSFEPAESVLLSRLGVRVMHMDEVDRRGFAACLDEARERAGGSTAGWGLSFDVDALDPRDAPGTGTPVASGIRLEAAVHALASCADDESLVAFELAEYNPLRDFGGRTARAVQRLIGAALARTPQVLALPV